MLLGGLITATACRAPATRTEAPAPTASGRSSGGVTGVLQDEAGTPLPATRVLACMTTVCLSTTTAGDGRFAFEIEPPADIAIKTDGDPEATPRRAAALRPVRLTDSRMLDVGSIRSPNLPAGTALGPLRQDPQTIQAGDGLVLSVHRGSLKPKPGHVLVDVAARKLDASLFAGYPVATGEEVLAIYALHPFATNSSTPIAVEAPAEVADGTVVSFRTISEIDGRLSESIPGVASGGRVSTDPNHGIRELTYLVVSRAR